MWIGSPSRPKPMASVRLHRVLVERQLALAARRAAHRRARVGGDPALGVDAHHLHLGGPHQLAGHLPGGDHHRVGGHAGALVHRVRLGHDAVGGDVHRRVGGGDGHQVVHLERAARRAARPGRSGCWRPGGRAPPRRRRAPPCSRGHRIDLGHGDERRGCRVDAGRAARRGAPRAAPGGGRPSAGASGPRARRSGRGSAARAGRGGAGRRSAAARPSPGRPARRASARPAERATSPRRMPGPARAARARQALVPAEAVLADREQRRPLADAERDHRAGLVERQVHAVVALDGAHHRAAGVAQEREPAVEHHQAVRARPAARRAPAPSPGGTGRPGARCRSPPARPRCAAPTSSRPTAAAPAGGRRR